MARDWENLFTRWATPPGQSETDRIDNAVRAIRNALDKDDFLSRMTRVYVQGSYRNRVNVREDSDVDLGVLYTGPTFFADYLNGVNRSAAGNVPSEYTYEQYKGSIETALVGHFGRTSVRRGTKAFDIRANTYRIDADVVPMFIHRRYDTSTDPTRYICGVELRADDGTRIINWSERLYDDEHWPRQHYENAVSKNTVTNKRFKAVVRILKCLRNELDQAGDAAAQSVVGFFVECLVWNAPHDCFAGPTWVSRVRSCVATLWKATLTKDTCSEWGEVSEFKYLFRPDDRRLQANAFLVAIWDHVFGEV